MQLTHVSAICYKVMENYLRTILEFEQRFATGDAHKEYFGSINDGRM